MKKRRNRKKQELSLEERLAAFADRWRREAEQGQDPQQWEAWQQRAKSTEVALGVIEWLATREMRR